MDWILANQKDILAAFGAAVALATVVVRLTPTKWDDALLSKLIRVFSLIGRDRKLT
jgi:hypothetical protein